MILEIKKLTLSVLTAEVNNETYYLPPQLKPWSAKVKKETLCQQVLAYLKKKVFAS